MSTALKVGWEIAAPFFEAKYSFLDVIDSWLVCFGEQLCQYFRSLLVMGVANLPLSFGKFSKIIGFLRWPLSHTLVVAVHLQVAPIIIGNNGK